MYFANCLTFDIQLFAEGAGGGTAGTGATGVTAADAGQQTGATGKDGLAAVVYGKQAATADTADAGQVNQTADQQRAAAFDAMIRGEYKDLYDAKVQSILGKRLKSSEGKVSQFDALSPTLDLLYRKYGVEAGNIEALNKAIDEDDAYYEEEALQKGLSVQQVKELRKMQRENEMLRQQVTERSTKEQAEKLYATWTEQAESTKQVYPNFDFQAEAKNEQFVQLLRSNIPVQTAYEVVHKDEILSSGMRFAAQETERKVAASIAAKGRRPGESGLSSQSAAMVKSDVSQLSKADRQEIARRVRMGEKIVF